jgi:WD40 repeat protein
MGTVTAGCAALETGPVVFVSYCREDAEWLRRFEVMLKPAIRERGIDLWSDTLITASRKWRPEIDAAIARADVALLLVSPGFLASEFIMGEELPALIARGVPRVSVLLRACRYGDVAELSEVQWAHDPGREGPLAELKKRMVDGAIVRVTNALMRVLDEHALSAAADVVLAPAAEHAGQRVSLRAVVPAAHQGSLSGVPEAPLGFVPREELDELRAALTEAGEGAIAITGGSSLGLHGQGGIGKTVLAAALARDPLVRHSFPDGVFWVTLGESPDLIATQIDLLARVGGTGAEVHNTLDGVNALRDALAERLCLVIVDDVWSAAAAQAFDVTGPRGRVMYTTRNPGTLRDVGARVRRIDVLSPGAARQLMAQVTATAVDELPDDVDRVLGATGRVALALALIGAAVGRGGRSWNAVADELEQAAGTFLTHPYANVFKAMGVAVTTLDPRLAAAHETLAVFREDERVPVAAIARLWSHLYELTLAKTDEWLQLLAQRGLLRIHGDTIALHDMQRDFLLLRVERLGLLHHELLEAYRALLPTPRSSWRELPQGEPYVWEHLVEHLIEAGEATQATAVARDLGWVAIRAFNYGPHAGEADVRRVIPLAPQDPAIAWVLSRLTQWGHLLTGHERIEDVAATLAVRATRAPEGVDAAGLGALLPVRTLDPIWGLPDAPEALQRVLEGHTLGVAAVAFSSNGEVLASAGPDGTVRLWDPATGAQIRVLQGEALDVYGTLPGVSSVAFGSDGRVLAGGGNDGAVRLWDVSSGVQTRILHGHELEVSGVAFAPDGSVLASGGHDWTVRLWDPMTGAQTRVLEGHTRGVSAVAFAPDGSVLASGGHDRTVRLWDPATGACISVLCTHSEPVLAVAFAPDGMMLAAGAWNGTVGLWNPANGNQTALDAHLHGVNALAFAADGSLLASASDGDGAIRIWNPATGAETNALETYTRGVSALAFAPNTSVLASAGGDATVQLWDPTSSTNSAVSGGHTGWVRAVAFSADGNILASAGDYGTVHLWNPVSGAQIGIIEGHTAAENGLAFSPDGCTLAGASSDGKVRLWDPATSAQIGALEGHTKRLNAVAFSPDGSVLASASDDGTVRLWDPATGAQNHILEGHTPVLAIAFAPDGRALASGNDHGVQLWDAANGTETNSLQTHGVLAVAFSPDGNVLASTGIEETVRLWDPTNGNQTGVLELSTAPLMAVAFAPNGIVVTSTGKNEMVQLWDTVTSTLTASVRIGAIAAIALRDDTIAIGLDRSLAVLHIVDRTVA